MSPTPAPTTGERPRRAEVLGLVAATAVTFVVAAAFLARREFWLDESFSYLAARQPIGNLLSFAVRSDGELNQLAYYALLKPFAAASATSWWLRIPSLVAVVAATPLVWLLADRVDGRRFVRVAAVLLFLSHPLVVDYAFEARAYGLLMVAVVGLTLLLVVALDGSRAAAIAYAVLLVATIAVHFLIVFVIIAHLLAIVVVTTGPVRRRVARAAALTGPALVVAAVAGLAVFRLQGTLANDDRLDLRSFGSAVYALTGRAGPLTLGVLVAVAAAAVAIARGRRPAVGWVVVLTVAVPAALAVAVSFDRPLFAPRYVAHLVPVLACLTAIGLAVIVTDRRFRVAALATFVALGVAGQAFVYRAPSKEPADTASAFITDRAAAGDLVAFNNPFAQIPFHHHLDETGRTGPTQVDVVADPAGPSATIELVPLADALTTLAPGSSAWILTDRGGPDRRDALEAELRAADLEPVERAQFGDIVVVRWARA